MLFRNLRLAVLYLSASVATGRGSSRADDQQPTCESRTINYITHTLPQQCLTSTPTAPIPVVTASDSASTVTAPRASQTTANAVAGSDTAAAPDADHDLDNDGNDLSTGAFMSFEEWKRMMLQKSGQENLEHRPRRAQEGRGEPLGDNYGTIGDEGELSLDFDAYSNKIPEFKTAGKPPQKENTKEEAAVEKLSYDEALGHVHRSKDARSKDAGKTCKERFSYASFDAGATVLKTSPKVKNSKAILVENKDAYMLMECGTPNKFFIVELSDDISVDTVVLANFEFFSSMVRQFRVSVSNRYPVKLDKWEVLGEYTARNSRDIQPFLVENPRIWARYLRIEILNHYGKEFYCPLSLLRVHGTRMLDSWREEDLNDADGELDGEEEETPKIEQGAEEPVEHTESIEVLLDETQVEESHIIDNVITESQQSTFNPFWSPSYFEDRFPFNPICAPGEESADPSQTQTGEGAGQRNATPAQPRPVATAGEKGRTMSPNVVHSSGQETTMNSAAPVPTTATDEHTSIQGSNTTSETATSTSPAAVENTQTASTKTVSTPPSRVAASTTVKSKTAVSTSLRLPSSKPATPRVSNGTTSRNKTATATSSSASAGPTVQDSFFKQMTKRLQNLESNTTLSMQYIESQSKFLQEALAKLERRHAAKVDLFLDSLNKTVMTELREFRSQYDQIWQSTVIALESQREKFDHEHLALSNRVGLLADEVVFQKRMAIVQSVLLLGCLFLVIFGRGIGNAGAEFYHSSQLQGSFSRLASPLYPSTPKGGGRGVPSSVRQAIEDPNGATPNRGLVSDSDNNVTPPRLRVDRGTTAEVRPQAQRHLSVSGNRLPSPSRADSQGTDIEMYQPPTPASLDAGYDSEPPRMPSSARDDYFLSNTNGEYAESDGEGTPADNVTPVLSHSTNGARLPTPFGDVDDHAGERGPQRRIIARASAATLKPLPALPEDPNHISE